ncbi:MAG: glutathione S-transferase family protein [Myxococcota bacterium]
MKLYIHPNSQNARRARIVARLAGSPVEEVHVDLPKRAQYEPAFLAMNPNHRVPVLDDGGFVLWESNAIGQYLAAKAGRTDLWPTDPREQADVSRWQFWCHTQWGPPLGVIQWERMMKAVFGGGPPDEAAVTAKLAELAVQAKLLDDHLAATDWLACGRLTLADVAIAASLTYAPALQLPLADTPRLSAWLDRIRALDAWKDTEPSWARRA